MRIGDITSVLRNARPVNLRDAEITSITLDSRRVKDGSVFVAVRGNKLDGHDFAGDAVRAGACACVCEETVFPLADKCHFIVKDTSLALSALAAAFYGRPSQSITCVGVTGTDGKTSTSAIIRDFLDAQGGAGLTGTVFYRYSGRKIPAERTTPDAVLLQELIGDMVSAGLKYVVIEVSSHGLVQNRTADIEFDVGVFTNLSPEHLDYHSTLENYRSAKAKLFENLPGGGFAVLNNEDPSSDYFAKITNARVVRYGKGGDIEAEIVNSGLGYTDILIKGLDMDTRVKIGLTGFHNVQNILAACCAARVLDVGPDTIAEVLGGISPVQGRLEIVATGLDCTVLIDYAHTSRALRCVLGELKPLCDGKLVVVFGCGGDRDRSKRPLMGKAAEDLADEVWVTSDNPRSEDPAEIIKEILSGMDRPETANVEADRETAIRNALKSTAAGDIILVAGKGHEKFQVMGNTAVPFDDREVVQRIGKDFHGTAVDTGS